MTAEFITPDMVITIRQPWASAIARGWKGVEIRSHRPPALDQWVAIRAAASALVNDGVRLCFPAEAAMRRGVIVAAVRFVQCASPSTCERCAYERRVLEAGGTDTARWPVGWHVIEAVPVEPLKWTGAQGIRRWTGPDLEIET